jgi:amino acid transporter
VTSELETFGYRQELKRSLRFADLFTYGLVVISPISPFAVYGVVFNASRGMVPLVYLVGLVAMAFTALSYMTLSRAFPIAGSVYTYASRTLGATVGFFSGWAILLDYVFLPTLSYVVSAIALFAIAPAVPKWEMIVAMVVVATVINYLGIETTARVSFALLALQIAIFIIFCAVAIVALARGVDGARVSLLPFFHPGLVTPSLVFGALSLAVLSFLGFDAISTLAEESQSGSGAIGRATMTSMCVSALLFVAQTWFASLFALDRTAFPPGPATDGAFYDISATIGGPVLKFLTAVPGAFLSAFAGAVAAQAATARLLYGMARDRELPAALAFVDPRRQVPTRAVLIVAGVTLVTGVVLADQLELLTSMVSFGALVAFALLHLAAIVHGARTHGRSNWWRYALAPGVGFLIIAYVLWNAEPNAKIAGGCWLLAGAVLHVGLRMRRPPVAAPD